MREIILGIVVTVVVIAWLLMIKNIITNTNLNIISNAIHAYNRDIIWGKIDGDLVGYDDMAGYCKTLFRFWDWGYKNILPKDKYELIKAYIGRDTYEY